MRTTPAWLLATCLALTAPRIAAADTWAIQAENDKLSTTPGGSDKYYTNGLRIGWTSGTEAVPELAARTAQMLWGDGTVRISFNLTQQIYSPQDINRRLPDPRDHPVAGYLAGTLALLHDTERSRSVLAATVGVIGPTALGQQVQNGWHTLIGVGLNHGWGSQLPDEPTVELVAERTWRLPLARVGALETDVLPSLTLGVGTVRDYLQTGFVLRLGQGLERDFGVSRIRPGQTGGDVFTPVDSLGWYVFLGASGQAVARDVFLDGSLWQHSASVPRNWLLGSMEAGAAVLWRGMRLSYAHTWQTQSFRGQKGGLFNFGSLSLSMRF